MFDTFLAHSFYYRKTLSNNEIQMKNLLIISPYFAPVNAADSHRVRMSLPYFKHFGWRAEVVTVDSHYSDLIEDPLLSESIPQDTVVHKVNALSKESTTKFGLGSIALRSLWFYFKYVNELLAKNKFDLIYFSTTQFPICILGRYWSQKYKVPYVIDMQDPWHSNYYEDKPKAEKPPKYWFSYHLDKYLEPIAIKKVDGLIAVNGVYIADLKSRYSSIKSIPTAVIKFSHAPIDFKIAETNKSNFKSYFNKNDKLKISYIGAAGAIMKESIQKVLIAFQCFIADHIEYENNIELYFLGTSYASGDQGSASISPLAEKMGLSEHIVEYTQRLTYYNAIAHMLNSDALLIIGSDNPNYIGSKIYNTLATNKPIFSLLHQDSPANAILENYTNVSCNYLQSAQNEIYSNFTKFIINIDLNYPVNENVFDAFNMTKKQCELFDSIVS